uniref:Uncharacterized protein n=1 Tax=viral metagenome TaxID=1070528 RepID=A0A6H1ZCJ7_9ZZZZ
MSSPEFFITFIAGFAVLLTLIYMLKTDSRSKRRRIFERIELIEKELKEYRKEVDDKYCTKHTFDVWREVITL